MTNKSNYCLRFLLLLGTLSALSIAVFVKCRPYFSYQSIHLCQQAVATFLVPLPIRVSSILWGVAGLIVLSIMIKALFLFKKIIKFERIIKLKTIESPKLEDVANQLGLHHRVVCLKTDELVACCFGIQKPTIYISLSLVNMVSVQELTAILLHEKHHLVSRDNLTLLIASLIQSVFPFFPLVDDFIQSYKINRELEADQSAIIIMGTSQPLIAVLKKLLSQVQSAPNILAAPLITEDTIEYRVRALCNLPVYLPHYNKANLLGSLLTLGVSVFLLITPTEALSVQHEEEGVRICVQEEITALLYSPAPNASYPFTPVN